MAHCILQALTLELGIPEIYIRSNIATVQYEAAGA